MKYETYTFDENILSDLHKDAYGFRPSGDFFREWDLLDNDGKQDLWEQLIDAVRDTTIWRLLSLRVGLRRR
jgi:hypothetical protein